MEVLIERPTGVEPVLLELPPGAGDAELVAALDLPDAGVLVDGRPLPDDAVLVDQLAPGARISVGGGAVHPLAPAAGECVLRVIGGAPGGLVSVLPDGRTTVGRSSRCDVVIDAPAVSAVHAAIDVSEHTVTITDLGATNGTRVDGVWADAPVVVKPESLVALGDVQLRIGPVADAPADADADCSGGRRTFHRPPRGPLPPAPAPVTPPEAGAAPRMGMHFGWATVLAPMGLALAMALLFGPLMAAFGIFSVVLVFANWWEDRRRAKGEAAGGAAAQQQALQTFTDAACAARAAEMTRRHAVLLDPATCVERAVLRTRTLWERRPADVDFLRCRVGLGTPDWRPDLDRRPGMAALDVGEVLDELGPLTDAPVGVGLHRGEVLGVVGPRALVDALVRGLLVQAVVTSGPADVRVAVLTARERAAGWGWVMWLPHVRGRDEAAGTRLLAGDPSDLDEVLAEVRALAAQPDVTVVVVVDADGLWEGRDAPVRDLLAEGEVAAILTGSAVERLPAVVTSVVEIADEHGRADLRRREALTAIPLLMAGAEREAAERCALALGRLEDPEVRGGAAQLASQVHLADLLDLDLDDVDALAARWRGAGHGLATPIGVTDDGPLLIDLDDDGPHALVAGTTGSGKSELLRTFVAGLAAQATPDAVTFVLVDYKGGSAFDACADLPHTVGVVTDLDEALSRRALRSLEAELRHRERALRDVDAEDLAAYRRQRDADPSLAPLPRLIVVCDEFATLASELPDFVDSLVGVAQRGRSLGVHLVLATQRPAGAVSDAIRANTNLRIALRVHDEADALDVVDSTEPARIGRHQRGRAFVRLGPGELRAMQTALVSGHAAQAGAHVRVAPLRFGPHPRSALAEPDAAKAASSTPLSSDLQRLVASTRSAHEKLQLAAPRRPWLAPLPAVLPLDELAAVPVPASTVAIGLLDEPAAQEQRPAVADLRRNLLVLGGEGSGTTTALATTALSIARRCSPDDVHLHLLDHGAGALRALADLPHVGTVAGATEPEISERLLRWLVDELARRRDAAADAAAAVHPGGQAGAPRVVVLIDGLGAVLEALDDPAHLELRERLVRVISDGPALGMTFVLAAERPGAIPTALTALIADRLVLTLADPADAVLLGLRPAGLPTGVPGRALGLPGQHELQLADPGSLRTAVDGLLHRWPAPRRAPHRVRLLPELVTAGEVTTAPRSPADSDSEDGVRLPIGLDDAFHAAAIVLRDGDHVLVSGPPRSGRSSALCAIAHAAASTGCRRVAIALRRSPLRDLDGIAEVAVSPDHAADLIGRLSESSSPTLLLVDDAEHVDDPPPAGAPAARGLAALATAAGDGLHIAAAGRADALRVAYGHWTAAVRRSGIGLALRPQLDLDGELWQTPLPRRVGSSMPPGRGLLVADGEVRLVQVALVAAPADPTAQR